MARTLDRNQPLGEIFGFSSDGRRYEQDGAYFDGEGNEIVLPGDLPAGPPAADEALPSVDFDLGDPALLLKPADGAPTGEPAAADQTAAAPAKAPTKAEKAAAAKAAATTGQVDDQLNA